MWSDLAPVGRSASSGGYFRQPWLSAERELATWFEEQCAARGLAVARDAVGNLVAWWGSSGPGAVVTGSHLDSVLDGGAYDGPLGVVSALAAIDELRARGFVPSRPLGVSVFVEEEGSRFGLACLGSRLATGAVSWEAARELRDRSGVFLADGLEAAGLSGIAGPRSAGGCRHVRGAARRAGPRPGGPVRRGRGGQRDLAARALPVRLHRVRRPRGHDAHGGPRGPDADVRDDRPGRQQAGPAGR